MKQVTGLLKRLTGAVALTSLLALNCQAQSVNPIQGSFNQYRQNNPQEKVFAHTDKNAYLTGEIIWFKLYVADGTWHKPLNLSKVAYVDVLDNNSVPVMQTKIELKNGSGAGSVYIPVTLGNGNYKLRAYTNWMKNFSPDYYFEKPLLIVNPQISPAASTAQGPAFDVQFFPEGGNLVNGVPTKVAFKTVGRDGMGIDFNGAIVDQKNDTVARFKPLKFGMGNFTFTPDAGDTYKAVIRAANAPAVTASLPAISKEGYAMHLTENGAQLKVTVNSVNAGSAGDVYLFVHTGQMVQAVKYAPLSNGVAEFSIDKNQLGEGISHITVFDASRRPVCERLYFKRPAKLLAIDASADKRQYGNRKKVSVAFSAKDDKGNMQNADLSMAVYRLDNFQKQDPADIASYFWLSSDLKGNIESPGYYLEDKSPEAAEAADNLMLTQGWRRFQWNDVLSNKQPSFSFLPELNGHLVTGKIVNGTTNAPAGDVVTYFAVPGKRVQVFASRSDSAGRLLFNTKDFYGPGEIVVQTDTEHDSTYRIDVLNPFSEQYSKNPLPPFMIKPDMQASLEKSSLGMQVLNLYSGSNIRKYIDATVDSTGFFGKPYKIYKLDDYTRFTTMEEVIREYIHEVWVNHSENHYHFKMISEAGFLEGDPLVLMDGVPVFNMGKIIAIDPLKIKRLDIIRDRYFWGPAAAEGIMNYTTYKGDLGGLDMDPHAVVLDYEGLQLQRVFYSPVYDTEDQVASRLPDFRNVLYWSPTLSSSTQEKKQVSFFTGDQEGQYIGVIQGMTADGTAGSQVFNFEVKK